MSQNKSLYEPWGAQGFENHRERGNLPATIKVVKAARKLVILFRLAGLAIAFSAKIIRNPSSTKCNMKHGSRV